MLQPHQQLLLSGTDVVAAPEHIEVYSPHLDRLVALEVLRLSLEGPKALELLVASTPTAVMMKCQPLSEAAKGASVAQWA